MMKKYELKKYLSESDSEFDDHSSCNSDRIKYYRQVYKIKLKANKGDLNMTSTDELFQRYHNLSNLVSWDTIKKKALKKNETKYDNVMDLEEKKPKRKKTLGRR